MPVHRLFISPKHGEAQIECQRISIVAGEGIEGDRYFGRKEEPGQNVTLIEVEEIEAFIKAHKHAEALSSTHRNILTRAVRLNELVGVEFYVGEVKLRGVELCEPCLGMGQALATNELSAAAVVKHFVRRGGLRAEALSSGSITLGAAIARTAA